MKTQPFVLPALAVAALVTIGGSARADEKGTRILREAYKTLNAAQAMTAKITMTVVPVGEDTAKTLVYKTGEVSAMKPNLLIVRLTDKLNEKANQEARKIEQVFVTSGKDYIMYDSTKNTYTKKKLEENPAEFSGEWEGEIDAFFGGEKNTDKGTADYIGMENVGAAPCNIVRVKTKPQDAEPERVLTYYVGQKDHLIHRTSWTIQTSDGIDLLMANTLTDINLKAVKKPEDFQFTLPKDAKFIKPKRDII